jgi:hypothetical protein
MDLWPVAPTTRPGQYPGRVDHRPRLATSDPTLVAAATTVAERVRRARDALDAAITERDAVIVALRSAGWGYDRIAAVLGVSKARAGQLCEALERPADLSVAHGAAG